MSGFSGNTLELVGKQRQGFLNHESLLLTNPYQAICTGVLLFQEPGKLLVFQDIFLIWHLYIINRSTNLL